MSHRPADPVVSGRPYVVLAVGDHPARTREDFVGPVELTLAFEDDARLVRGVGTPTADGVRFTEKDRETAKDVRTWLVRSGNGGWCAEPVAAF